MQAILFLAMLPLIFIPHAHAQAPKTYVPLRINTVTTGGVAVQALNPGDHSRGGWLQNPPTATTNLCINENGVAAGTTTLGPLICIGPNQTYTLQEGPSAVSVITSDSGHGFGGWGFQ